MTCMQLLHMTVRYHHAQVHQVEVRNMPEMQRASLYSEGGAESEGLAGGVWAPSSEATRAVPERPRR